MKAAWKCSIAVRGLDMMVTSNDILFWALSKKRRPWFLRCLRRVEVLIDPKRVVLQFFTRHCYLSSMCAVLVPLMYCHTEEYGSRLLRPENDCNNAAVLLMLGFPDKALIRDESQSERPFVCIETTLEGGKGSLLNQKTGILSNWTFRTRNNNLEMTAISNIDCTVQYILYFITVNFNFYNLVIQLITTCTCYYYLNM